MINFEIRTAGHPGEFYAQRPAGELLATISPRLMPSSKKSERFMNVCFMDGSVEIAEGMEHASELIVAKCGVMNEAQREAVANADAHTNNVGVADV